MTREAFILKLTNMLRLTFGARAQQAKLFAETLARTTNCFVFADKPRYTEDQLELMTDVFTTAARMAHPDAGVVAMKTDQGETVVAIPLEQWRELCAALSGRKQQEWLEQQKRQASGIQLADARDLPIAPAGHPQG